MTDIFQKDYPIRFSFKQDFIISTGISLFVFLFLKLFLPFGLDEFEDRSTEITLGYGLVSFGIMSIFFFVISRWLDEEKWNIGKNIVWIVLIIITISIGNLIYSDMIQVLEFTFKNYLRIGSYTIIVSIFPVSLITMYQEKKLAQKYLLESNKLEVRSEKKELISEKVEVFDNDQKIELELSNVMLIKSDANYCDLYFLNNDKIEKKTIRTTLKRVEENNSKLFRSSRSYLVNLEHVSRISGNASGFKLHLNGLDQLIPVSRTNNEFIVNHFRSK